MVWTHFGHTVSLKPGSLICWIYIQYFHNTHLYKYRYCHKSRQTWVFVLCHTDSASKSRPWTYAALPLTQKSKVWLLFWLLKATVSNAKRFGKRFTTLFTTFSEYLSNYTVMFFFFLNNIQRQRTGSKPRGGSLSPRQQQSFSRSTKHGWALWHILLKYNDDCVGQKPT